MPPRTRSEGAGTHRMIGQWSAYDLRSAPDLASDNLGALAFSLCLEYPWNLIGSLALNTLHAPKPRRCGLRVPVENASTTFKELSHARFSIALLFDRFPLDRHRNRAAYRLPGGSSSRFQRRFQWRLHLGRVIVRALLWQRAEEQKLQPFGDVDQHRRIGGDHLRGQHQRHGLFGERTQLADGTLSETKRDVHADFCAGVCGLRQWDVRRRIHCRQLTAEYRAFRNGNGTRSVVG